MKPRSRFIFETKWTKGQECEALIKEVWKTPVKGSRMFKVKQKLKWAKHNFIKWRKDQKCNARKDIEIIQQEMEQMQDQGESRD